MRTISTALIFLLASLGCTSASEVDVAGESAGELVLVAGATGNTGMHVVTTLLDKGYAVRAFVRDRAKAEERLPAGIDIAVGDVKDRATIATAMQGVTDVVSAIGAAAPSGPNSPEFVDYGGIKNLVDEAVAAGADQFVLVSSLGATKKEHYLNERFGNVLIWKLKGEDYLRDSGLDYTVVRPGGLTDESARQNALLVDQGDEMETGRIPRADVAEICVAALGEASARNKTFEVVTRDGPPSRDWGALFASLAPDD